MSEFSDALGLPKSFKHAPWQRDKEGNPIMGSDGKVLRHSPRDFQLAPPDRLDVLGHWEQYLEDQAYAVIKRRYGTNYDLLSVKERELDIAIVGGDYSVFGMASVKAMTNPRLPHFRKFIELCMKPYHPDEAALIAEEFAIDQRAEWLSFMRGAMQAETVPNGAAPAPAGDTASASSPS